LRDRDKQARKMEIFPFSSHSWTNRKKRKSFLRWQKGKGDIEKERQSSKIILWKYFYHKQQIEE
jgi:hypothetical protein